MIEENKVIDKIEVLESNVIQVREATRIIKDGQQIAQTFHRWSFAPDSDVSTMPQNVQDIAKVVWTQEVIDAYKASLERAV